MFHRIKKVIIFAPALGEMAEWSNAAVLKTVEGHTSGGSNPSFSASKSFTRRVELFLFSVDGKHSFLNHFSLHRSNF